MRDRPKRNKEIKREALPAKVHPNIKRIVEEIASEKDRTISNMVEHLLSESPLVKRRLRQLAVVGS